MCIRDRPFAAVGKNFKPSFMLKQIIYTLNYRKAYLSVKNRGNSTHNLKKKFIIFIMNTAFDLYKAASVDYL